MRLGVPTGGGGFPGIDAVTRVAANRAARTCESRVVGILPRAGTFPAASRVDPVRRGSGPGEARDAIRIFGSDGAVVRGGGCAPVATIPLSTVREGLRVVDAGPPDVSRAFFG